MNNLTTGSSRDILRLIRQHRCVDRVHLAEMIGVTHAGVSKIINDLVDQGTIHEAGELRPKGRGRPSRTFQLARNGAYALGIAIKVDRIQFMLIDWLHTVVAESELPNQLAKPGYEQQAVAEVVAEACRLVPRNVRSKLLGVSVASVGLFDSRNRKPIRLNNVADMEQAEALLDALHSRLHTTASFINDVDASLLAERWAMGDQPTPGHLIYINDLLGFSILLDGQTNLSWLATRRWLGRAHVQRDAQPRPPGFHGCLAETASLGGITDQLARYPFGTRPRLSGEQWGSELIALARRYDAGDGEVRAIVHRAFDDLGFVVRNLCVQFDISGIVLEGWTESMLADGIQIVHRVLAEGSYPQADESEDHPPLVRANSLGKVQQVLGAAISTIEHRLGVIASLHHHRSNATFRSEQRRPLGPRISERIPMESTTF